RHWAGGAPGGADGTGGAGGAPGAGRPRASGAPGAAGTAAAPGRPGAPGTPTGPGPHRATAPPETAPALPPSPDPAAALRRMYVDTSPFSAAHLSLNAEVLGPERMLFGTDSPPMAAPLEDFVHMVEKLPLDKAAQQLILGGNAQALFDLRSRP
ncbi:amidohydrolase family protein, partial [Streptomyces achromogenes]|uniref:amidohydrolase family protein n=1 Tax=Streptomyces achromogenes TaxID=67255 RepID=UPI003A804329